MPKDQQKQEEEEEERKGYKKQRQRTEGHMRKGETKLNNYTEPDTSSSSARHVRWMFTIIGVHGPVRFPASVLCFPHLTFH